MRSQLTPCTIQLSEIEIVIDKMHMAGHIDRWCLENCDPKLFTDLNEVRRVKSEFSLQSSSMHVLRLIQKSVSNIFSGYQSTQR